MADYVIVSVTGDGRDRKAVVYVPNDAAALKSFETTWRGAQNAVRATLLRSVGRAVTIMAGAWWTEHAQDVCECGQTRDGHTEAHGFRLQKRAFS